MASHSSTSSHDPESPKRHHDGLMGSLRRKFKGLSFRATSLSSRIRQVSLSGSSYSPPASISSPFFDCDYRTSSDSSRIYKSLSDRPSTLPILDFRRDDGFKLIEQMYGLPENPDVSPAVARMPIRTVRPSITKTPDLSPVELPATETAVPNAVNTTNPVMPKSVTEQQLAEAVGPVPTLVPSADQFDLRHVRSFDSQHNGDVDAVSAIGTDCGSSLRCRDYWKDVMRKPPAVDIPTKTKRSGDGILDGLDQTPACIEAGSEEDLPSKTDEKGREFLTVEDEDIEEDEDEDMAARLGGLA